MDDPQLQRAIYASIQSARSQGYQLGTNKGSNTAYRPSVHPTRGGGGSGTHAGHRPGVSQNANQSQARAYTGNSLPVRGPAASGSGGADARTLMLRTSYGRIESLRRDGIVPAAPSSPGSPAGPQQAPGTHGSHPPRASSTSRPLPASVPPRLPATPPRLRNAQRQQQQHQPQVHPGQAARGLGPRLQQPQQHQQRRDDRRGTGVRQSGLQIHSSPILEAIAAATAMPAHESGLPLSPVGLYVPATPAAAARPPTVQPQPPPSQSPQSGPSRAVGPAGAVGGNAPPPRALVPLAAGPGGSVVMVPENVDPVLAQAVLRDAVTWDLGVTFDDIAGCDRAKQLLHEAVALPLIIPEFFTGIREPWRGVLLHGPPGNGKTMLAKAVAGMVGGAFFAVSPASLTSKWRGESEKLLATLFAVAQAHAPAIIFVDEVDALGGARGAEGEHEASRRFKAELLQQMDGMASGRGVMVLAATNCPWDLDPALRRRLEKRIHIGLPDREQRLALLQLHLRGLALAPDVDLPALAAACEGFSGADIRLLCRDAAMAPLRRQIGGLAPNLTSAPQPSSSSAQPSDDNALSSQQQQQPQKPAPLTSPTRNGAAAAPVAPAPAPPAPLVLRSAADIRRLADSGELARGAVVSAADLEAARGSVRPSVSAEQAARYVLWDREFAST